MSYLEGPPAKYLKTQACFLTLLVAIHSAVDDELDLSRLIVFWIGVADDV